MGRIELAAIGLLLLSYSGVTAGAEFNADVQRAGKTVQQVLPASEELMTLGDFAGANAKILSSFPAESRTPGESFMLGNVLFELDRKQSYALHQAAAKAEPNNPTVTWEWAMQQHRAKEYAAALASYQAFSKARPQSAASYALQADCLLHLNRIDDAIAAWHQSEVAPSGSLEQMENLVCAVNREPTPHQRRAELLAKVMKQQDVQAAVDLIALDSDFPRDWWNAGPHELYLAHDAPAVSAALKLPAEDLRGRSMACAAACATADREKPAAVKEALSKNRLLTDSALTLPTDGPLLSVILRAVFESKAIDDQTLRQKLGPKILDAARKGHDKDLWNAAAFTTAETAPDKRLNFEREGWQAAADPRFASGVLYLKLVGGQLKSDDLDLKAALKQFPDSGEVHRAAYEAAGSENNLTKELLANAARAEFHHFSSFVAPATVVKRPRSNYLREYFAQLARLPGAKKPQNP